MERYEQLRNRVEELQEAMQSYPDALDSPYWDEYERALYALAEMDLAISAEVEGRYALADMAEMAERASLVELEQFGFIEPPEDLGDLEDFAILDGVLSQLEECFETGNVGGAEIHEYNDATRAMDALLARL